MKAYKMVLLFIDHESLIENARLPNHVSPGHVMPIEERDVGEWHDDHPLNLRGQQLAAFEALFNTPATRRAFSAANEHDLCLDCGTLLVPCTCRPDCGGGMCPVCP